jgi:hypothetical protein
VEARISDARFASILQDIQAQQSVEAESNPKPVEPGIVVDFNDSLGDLTPPERAERPLGSVPAGSAGGDDERAPDESRGRVDAEFSLTGIVDNAGSRRGRGSIIVGGERVINVPLLVPLLRITNLQLPIAERLDFASARFFLSGEVINLEEILVSSRTVAIEGVGTATMPDYDLDLRFVARNKGGIPILSPIFERIRNELVTGEVRGTIGDPSIRIRPFSGTRRMVNSAIGNDRSTPDRWLDELESQPRSTPSNAPAGRRPVPTTTSPAPAVPASN